MGGLRTGGRPLRRGILAVFIGGCVGGALRYLVVSAWPTSADGFPWPTLVVNLAGAFILGLLLVYVEARRPHHHLRPLLGTGFCGALTTFGSVTVVVDQRLDDHLLLGSSYLLLSFGGGLALATLGFVLGSTAWHAHPVTVDIDADVDD